MIRKLARYLLKPYQVNDIKRILGHDIYQPIRKMRYKRVVFIHIPKTGGTSVSDIIGPLEHRTAKEIQEIIGEKRWRDVYKFAFVRNPWDLVYSHYKFKVKQNHQDLGTNPIEFNHWVEKVYGEQPDNFYRHNDKMYRQQMDWLTDNNEKLNIDFIGRFENITEDFEKVSYIIGANSSIRHLNKTETKHYKEAYNQKSKELINKAFSKDIDYWDFKY